MTSPFILWALLCLALVKVRSDEVPLDNLESENYWNEVTVSEIEQSASKTDLENQNEVENEAVHGRSGLDGLSLFVGSSQLSDSEAMNLGTTLDETNLREVSDTSKLMGRLSGMEANKSPETNYENLANLRESIEPVATSSDIDSLNELKIINMMNRIHDAEEHASLSDPHNEGILTLISRSGYNDLNPVNVGLNVARLNTVSGLKSGGRDHLNGLDLVNEAGLSSANAHDSAYIVKSGSLNDVLRNTLNNFNNIDMTQKIGRTDSLRANDGSRNDVRVSDCNNLNSQGVSRTSINNLEDAFNAHNSNNQRNTNKGRNAELDNSKKSLVLKGVNRRDKSSNVNSINALNNLDLNALDSEALNRNSDKESANLIESVNADSNRVNQLDPINSLELDRVSLNSLNKAKKLLGPLNLNRDLSARSNSEVDEELLNALNVEGDFNALGALVVLSKIAEKPNSLRAPNEAADSRNSRNVNARNEMKKNVDPNLLRNLGAPDDVSEIAELASSNPLPHIIDNLYSLARIDSANDDEQEINLQSILKSSSENRNNLDQSNTISRSESQPFESKSDNDMNNSPSTANTLDDNTSIKLEMDRRGLYVPYRVPRPIRRPNKLFKPYRPSRPLNFARYQPRASSGLNEGQNLNSLDSDRLSIKLLNDNNLNNLNDNTPIVSLREDKNDYSLHELLSSTDKTGISGISVDVNEAQTKTPKAHHSMNNAKGADRRLNLNEINRLDSEGNMKSPTELNNLREGSNLLLNSADSTLTQLRSPAKLNVKLLNKEDIDALNNLVPLPVMLSSDLNKAGVLYGLVHLNEMN